MTCFPLYAKILLWFFLNLLLLGLAFSVFLGAQLHFGLDALLAGRAGDRLRAVSELIVREIDLRPRPEWDEILARFNDAYGVQFYLFRDDGTQLAGLAVVLPPPVREKLAELSPPAGLWGGPGLRPLPGPRGPLAEPVRPEFGGPGPADGLPNGAPPRRRPEPRYVIRTPAPSRYWVVVRTAARERERQVLTPLALLVRSETLSFGGLFFEVTPWLLAGGGVIVFSVLFWIPLVRSITRSVAQMTAATARIAEGRFDVRVDARRADELGLLGAGINRMAGRLEHLVSGQKRFLSDVAHELLTRALANLLRNAARYAGPAGPVTVSVQRHGSEVQLRVADHGPGIPETELGKVFDPFYRLDASRDRQTGGVGLGLAIVRTCVESCGGTVTAHNRAPQGLEVRIRLAAAQAPAATTP